MNKNNFVAIGKILNIDMNSKDEVKSKVTLQYRILNPINITDDFIQSKNN